jgi:nitrite reductase (NO-forming)
MITRRAALVGAAVAALLGAAPALADEDLKLPRQAIQLVAPPFVHPHEQATKEGPKIIEEQEVVIDNEHQVSVDDVQRLDAGTDDGGA